MSVSVPTCFAKGTLITTDIGRVAIEALRPGDRVLTADNGYKPVRWIGWREVELESLPEAEKRRNQPMLIRHSALGTAVPCHDLVLSVSHAVVVCGRLMAAGALLGLRNPNIVALQSLRTVTYYHIECDEFEIIYANDVPAESFVDVGNRHAFKSHLGEPAHVMNAKPRFARSERAVSSHASQPQDARKEQAGELVASEV
jgi:hypothetical protein